MIPLAGLYLQRVTHLGAVASLLGVARRTLYRWLERGAKEEKRLAKGEALDDEASLYVGFRRTMKKGLAEFEANCVEGIKNAGPNYWQAFAWLLERRWPQRWGNQTRLIRDLAKKVEELEKIIGGGVSATTEA